MSFQDWMDAGYPARVAAQLAAITDDEGPSPAVLLERTMDLVRLGLIDASSARMWLDCLCPELRYL